MKGLEIYLFLALLGLLPDVHAATTTTSASSSPTPMSTKWAAALAKAKDAVKKLSNADKASLGSGTWNKGPCIGNTAAVPSINFPGYCLQDAPLGVRIAKGVSVFPAGINAAATWDRDLIRQRGTAIGEEFKGKGVHIALGPAMNLARAPTAGRNWEGFGGDPYLTGEAAYETIVGMQSKGVQACAKHYINNEQELHRGSSSSDVDDRTQHEVYAHTFLRSVQAGVTSVMCSYNKVNNTYACENDKTINQILKKEFGFQGFVLSDWWANIAGPTSANMGLDMVMPGETGYQTGVPLFGPALVTAVQNGQVPQSRLDDMATRILAGWYYQGQDVGYPPVRFDSGVDVQGNHKQLIRQIGAASTVLLKNVGGVLPLKKPSSLAVIGKDGGPPSSGNPNAYGDRAGNDGILAIGWGSGTAEFPYLIDPLAAIKARAQADGTTVTSSLSDSDLNAARAAATGKSFALVFINADSGEEYITVEGNAGDRNDLKAWHGGDALVTAVANANNNTIVVVHSVGTIIMEPWIDHPNIKAVVWAGLQGQEAGNSLVDILYGVVNPSAKLPYTIAKKGSDYPAQVSPNANIPYSEGLFIDYRHFDKNNIAPRYEFGFGLSYTTFQFSSLSIGTPSSTGGSAPTGPGSSASAWLHDDWVSVTFSLKNTGSVKGAEVAQLYVSPPASANSPPSQLRGFSKVELAPGASSTVTIKLSRYSFSVWDVVQQKWVIPAGRHNIWVGASSRDKRLTGSIVF
ncbi:hypothetical protein FRC03_006312 [Tulasnella sp. 419]|nr:hypothetical protein FRC03_006312 [Tulasnella sp. 419]